MEQDAQRDPQTYAIIGAAMEVHRELGPGFLEAVYQEAMSIELTDRGIPHVREAALVVKYKDLPLQTHYRADLICYGEIIVEMKSQVALTGIDKAQLINYLKATRYQRGLLFNFGESSLVFHRFLV